MWLLHGIEGKQMSSNPRQEVSVYLLSSVDQPSALKQVGACTVSYVVHSGAAAGKLEHWHRDNQWEGLGIWPSVQWWSTRWADVALGLFVCAFQGAWAYWLPHRKSVRQRVFCSVVPFNKSLSWIVHAMTIQLRLFRCATDWLYLDVMICRRAYFHRGLQRCMLQYASQLLRSKRANKYY